MSPSKISALAALFAGLSVSAALAQPPTGYYFGGGLGATIAEDSDIDGAGIDTEADMDTGFAGVAAFGYRYGSNYRGEIELGYRTNGIDGLSGATTAVQGDVNTWTLMANVLYDYSPAGKFRPYFGVGAGIARIDIDGAPPVDGTTINDHDASHPRHPRPYDWRCRGNFRHRRYLHARPIDASGARSTRTTTTTPSWSACATDWRGRPRPRPIRRRRRWNRPKTPRPSDILRLEQRITPSASHLSEAAAHANPARG